MKADVDLDPENAREIVADQKNVFIKKSAKSVQMKMRVVTAVLQVLKGQRQHVMIRVNAIAKRALEGLSAMNANQNTLDTLTVEIVTVMSKDPRTRPVTMTAIVIAKPALKAQNAMLVFTVNLKNGLIGPNVEILAEKEPGNVLAQTYVTTEKKLTKWKRKQSHAKITLIATLTLNLGLNGPNAQAVEKESKPEKGIVEDSMDARTEKYLKR